MLGCWPAGILNILIGEHESFHIVHRNPACGELAFKAHKVAIFYCMKI